MRRLAPRAPARRAPRAAAMDYDAVAEAQKKALVDDVKRLHRASPEAKEQWYAYCQMAGTTSYDPSRHEENFLRIFLTSVNAGMGQALVAPDAVAKASLVMKVKAFQRGGEGPKDQWRAYCTKHGFHTFDPSRHEEDFLKGFINSVDPSLMNSHPGSKHPSYETTETIFVGGLNKTVTIQELQHYFSNFGKVLDVKVKMDDVANSRGFGFITFENVASSQAVLDSYTDHKLNGKWIDCKAAVPKELLHTKGKSADRDGVIPPISLGQYQQAVQAQVQLVAEQVLAAGSGDGDYVDWSAVVAAAVPQAMAAAASSQEQLAKEMAAAAVEEYAAAALLQGATPSDLALYQAAGAVAPAAHAAGAGDGLSGNWDTGDWDTGDWDAGGGEDWAAQLMEMGRQLMQKGLKAKSKGKGATSSSSGKGGSLSGTGASDSLGCIADRLAGIAEAAGVSSMVIADTSTGKGVGVGFDACMGVGVVLEPGALSMKAQGITSFTKAEVVPPPAHSLSGRGSNKNAWSTKLFVGGLPKDVSPVAVIKYFRTFGEVKSVELKHGPDGEFRRYGFVQFESTEAVQAVLDNHLQNRVDGRWVDCRCAGEHDGTEDGRDGKGGDMFRGFGGAGSGATRSKLQIDSMLRCRGVPFQTTPEQVMAFFEGFKPVGCSTVMDAAGRASGEALVEFDDITSCAAAFSLKQRGKIGHRYVELFQATVEDVSQMVPMKTICSKGDEYGPLSEAKKASARSVAPYLL